MGCPGRPCPHIALAITARVDCYSYSANSSSLCDPLAPNMALFAYQACSEFAVITLFLLALRKEEVNLSISENSKNTKNIWFFN